MLNFDLAAVGVDVGVGVGGRDGLFEKPDEFRVTCLGLPTSHHGHPHHT